MALATLDDVDLAWRGEGPVATLRLAHRETSDATPTATTLRFTADGERVRVGLVLLEGRRPVDVSIQPALVARTVLGGPRAQRSTQAAAQVCHWLAAFAEAHGAWRPDDPAAVGLVGVVGGAAFPLLGAAQAAGAAPLDEVPRWAAGPLAAATARGGALLAFPGRATRPVVAAFAAGLVAGRTAPLHSSAEGPAPAGLYPLALGLMAPALAPDRLARVLGATEPWRGPQDWPDVALIAEARRLTPHLGEHRTERVLLDAAQLDGGPALLAEALQAYGLVRHRLGRRLPNRLAELRAHCVALLPADPNPLGLEAAPRRRRSPSAAPRPRASSPAPRLAPSVPAPRPVPAPPTDDDRRRAMFNAPATRAATVPEHLALAHPAAVLALAGREVASGSGGRLRFLVPRTAAELAEWGNRLHNCVGGFGPAVNEGRSIVLGVEADERVAYCIDVRPDGTIRQFLGARNRPVPRPDALAVVHALADAGVVRSGLAANQPWFAEA